MNDNIRLTEQYTVKLPFPADVEKLAKVLDWMFNDGAFLKCHMSDEVIAKFKKDTGLSADKVE